MNFQTMPTGSDSASKHQFSDITVDVPVVTGIPTAREARKQLILGQS